MSHPPMIILYVADVAISTDFYATQFALPVGYNTPGFAILTLPGGAQLGLWKQEAVQPAAAGRPGAAELALPMVDAASLRAQHDRLAALGVQILQAPTELGFGLACTLADPDGHRVRLFVPQEAR